MKLTHEEQALYEAAVRSEGFKNWVDMVTPPTTGEIHKVWLPELIAILRLLWEIYQWLKEKGWIRNILITWKVSRAMRLPSEMDTELALKNLKGVYNIR